MTRAKPGGTLSLLVPTSSRLNGHAEKVEALTESKSEANKA